MQLIEENLRLKEQVSTLNFICPVETRQRLGDVNHFPLSKKKTFSLCLLCSFIWLNDDLKLQVSRMSRMEEMQPGPDSEIVYEEGQSSESVTNASYPRPPPDNDYSSDTSLRLGWVLPYFQFQLLPEFMCQETTEVSSMMNIQVQMMSCLLIDFACGRLSLFSSKWWLETKTERKQLDGMPASPNDQCMHCKTATNNTVLDCQMMMCVCWVTGYYRTHNNNRTNKFFCSWMLPEFYSHTCCQWLCNRVSAIPAESNRLQGNKLFFLKVLASLVQFISRRKTKANRTIYQKSFLGKAFISPFLPVWKQSLQNKTTMNVTKGGKSTSEAYRI